MNALDTKNIFIGVAWPYVNGDLHIGHYAGYLLPADISARYHRLVGRNVLMVSGSDCFGTPITIEADKRHTSPREIVDEYHERDVKLFELLDLSYDLYTKTDTDNHRKVTQDFFLELLKKGYIFKGSSNQYYSEDEKRFLPDRYVEGTCPICGFTQARSDQCDKCGNVIEAGALRNPISKNTKTLVALRETEHYFLDWPKLQTFLESFVAKTGETEEWRKWVLNESLGWLKTGLKPREITRDLDWGVELPIDRIPKDLKIKDIENKRIYVWFDAVIGYYSASLEWTQKTGLDWKEFWYGDKSYHYYFMGKDNLIFHTLFWPGQLHGFDDKLHLPDMPAINQFLNLKGQKFSKSRNVIVDTKYIVEKYGNDTVRFYLCLIMPENEDANFTWEDFYQKVNNVLIGNFGNFVNRVLTLAKGMDFSNFSNDTLNTEIATKIELAFQSARDYLDKCEFKNYLNEILVLSAFGNSLMSDKEPWKMNKNGKEFGKTLYNLLAVTIALDMLVVPLMNATSKKLSNLLSIDEMHLWPKQSDLVDEIIKSLKKVSISKVEPLFVKLDKKIVEEETNKISK